MPVTTIGLQTVLQNAIGQGTPFSGANMKLAVGDSSATFSAAQTNLAGSQTYAKAVTTGYPLLTGSKLQAQARFEAAEANFDWNEWGIFNGTPGSAQMLNRSIDTLGRKVQGQTWILTATVEFVLV